MTAATTTALPALEIVTSGLPHQRHHHLVGHENDTWPDYTDHCSNGEGVVIDDDGNGPWTYNSTGWLVLGYLQVGYVPTMSAAGIVGNVLSMMIFLRTNLRARSSSYYLAALAAADTTFLVQLLVVYLAYLDLDMYNRSGGCQALVYLSSVSTFLSVWLVVAFTAERFIAIQYPLHRPKVCTVTRAKRTIVGLAVASLVANAYLPFTAGAVENEHGQVACDVYPSLHGAFLVINVLDMLATLVLPVSLIVLMNSVMAVQLLRFSRCQRQAAEEERQTAARATVVAFRSDSRRHHGHQHHPQPNALTSSPSSSKSPSSSSSPSPPSPHHQQQKNNNNNTSVTKTMTTTTTAVAIGTVNRGRDHNDLDQYQSRKVGNDYYAHGGAGSRRPMQQHQQQQMRTKIASRTTLSQRAQYNITKMLLLISTAFVCLNLPSYVMRLHNYYHRDCVSEGTYLLQQYTMILFYTNFSINFLLYSAYGLSFRKALCEYARRHLTSS